MMGPRWINRFDSDLYIPRTLLQRFLVILSSLCWSEAVASPSLSLQCILNFGIAFPILCSSSAQDFLQIWFLPKESQDSTMVRLHLSCSLLFSSRLGPYCVSTHLEQTKSHFPQKRLISVRSAGFILEQYYTAYTTVFAPSSG